MRLWCLSALALFTLIPLSPAQEIQGPEPGVFVYDYDEATQLFTRTYCNTQAEANDALAERLTAARLAAVQLNQMAQTNYEYEAVAQWLLFGEQWMLWQEWVLQEYGLAPAEGAQTDLLTESPLRFNPVEGVVPHWDQVAQPAPGEGAAQRPQSASNQDRDAMAGEFEAELMGEASASENQAPAAPQTPPAGVHFFEFLLMTPEQRQAHMETTQQYLQAAVQEDANQKYEVLTALLEAVDESELMRERREAFIASRQVEITDLRDVILNRQNATEIVIGGRQYLFSDQPLNRIPEDAINIPTPNLSPYDIFNEDGTVRSAEQ